MGKEQSGLSVSLLEDLKFPPNTVIHNEREVNSQRNQVLLGRRMDASQHYQKKLLSTKEMGKEENNIDLNERKVYNGYITLLGHYKNSGSITYQMYFFLAGSCS